MVKTFCCGCTLKSGTFIIGVYHAVAGLIGVVAMVQYLKIIQSAKPSEPTIYSYDKNVTGLSLDELQILFIAVLILLGLYAGMGIVLAIGASTGSILACKISFCFNVIFIFLELLLSFWIGAMARTFPLVGIFRMALEVYLLVAVYSFIAELNYPGGQQSLV